VDENTKMVSSLRLGAIFVWIKRSEDILQTRENSWNCEGENNNLAKM